LVRTKIKKMAKDINDSKSVTEFIEKLQPKHGLLIEKIRKVVLATDKEIAEQIKWNSPSFFYAGEMKAFNAKEYKRDILVIHTRKEQALLVFPTGAKIPNPIGILEGDYTDGRRMITFKTIEEVDKKEKDLQKIIKSWLLLVDK
jgi:hypothetical protein